MNKYLVFILFAIIFSSCQQQEANQPSKRPNIILIMTDDQGYGDLGFHGNPDIKTLVLDAFAKESTRFTNFYVSPVCAPTRAALMTGRYSLRTGVCDTYNGWAIMASEEKTMAEILKENGYATSISGKWHLGDNYPSRPQDQGFDYSLIHRAGGMVQVGDPDTWFRRDSGYFDPILLENGNKLKKQGYCSDIFTDATIEFIEKNKDQPFFSYLAFNAPHTPLQLPKKYEEMYVDLEIDSNKYAKHDRPFPKMDKPQKNAAKKIYGMVSNIDDNIGRLLNKLEELNLKENTIVIFMTDNGPQQVRYNGGLRGRKGSVYEGGVHVPFFIRYPKKLKANYEIDVPAAHFDLLPTLLDICGIPQPPNLDGKSLWPLLQGNTVNWADDRPIFFDWNRGYPERYRNMAVRRGNFKLVGHVDHNAKPSDFELYDLSKDPGEIQNICDQKPALATELKALFDNWYDGIIKSPNLGNVPIIIGSEKENPTLLSRNDAKGSWGIWAQKEIFGYWDVRVEEEAEFNIKCYFEKPLEGRGAMRIRLGKLQLMQEVEADTQEIIFKKVKREKGRFNIEAGFRNSGNWQVKFPFYLEIEKINT